MLDACLAALAADRTAADADLVVVDNNSDDDSTRAVATRHGRRVISETAPGVSAARNAGAAATSAEILLFLDDDVRVSDGWAAAMSDPILRGEASATVCRFRLPPSYEPGRASPASLAALMTDNSIDPAHPFLVGGSMGIARASFDRAGGFHRSLGPGALGAGGEDLLMTLQLQRLAQRIAFVESTAIEHWFDPCKLEHAALVERAAAGARSDAWLSYHWFGRNSPRAAAKARLFKALLRLARVSPGGYGVDSREGRLAARAAWHEQFASEARRPRVRLRGLTVAAADSQPG